MLPEPEALEELLARHGAQAAPWLQRQFGISQPSLSRVVARALVALPALRRFGRGKSTVYALAAAAAPSPVWRITETGERFNAAASKSFGFAVSASRVACAAFT